MRSKQVYIRRKGRDTWHWMTGCHHFRKFMEMGLFKTWVSGIDHFAKFSRPKGDLCNECRAKETYPKRAGRSQ